MLLFFLLHGFECSKVNLFSKRINKTLAGNAESSLEMESALMEEAEIVFHCRSKLLSWCCPKTYRPFQGVSCM